MTETATQFAWKCCQAGEFHPPKPKRGDRYGIDDVCWLCGGPTHNVGWPRKLAIADTFTDYAEAKRLASQTVCQSCAALSKSEGWAHYVKAHPEKGYELAFPEKEGKKPKALNWLYFSHVFHHGGHSTLTRAQLRAVLLEPPQPPFLLVAAISGKKQLIFKGRLSDSKDVFWVQADDSRIRVVYIDFLICLLDFERLYNLGFSKDSIKTGQYHHGQLLTVGLSGWKTAENAFSPWRRADPDLVSLVHFCAVHPEGWEKPERITLEPPSPLVIRSDVPQFSLF